MDEENFKQAEEILIASTGDAEITSRIYSTFDRWKSENYPESLKGKLQGIRNICLEIFEALYEEHNDVTPSVLNYILFNKIHDIIMPTIKTYLSRNDLHLFEKLKSLSTLNVSAEQFGANVNYAIPLCAAVVELSVLDGYKTPMGKMHCLSTAYDLVFAELKTAMILSISKNSEKEIEIPIINNEDVIPLLMAVIVKSKLAYMYSNMFYITKFHYTSENNDNELNIMVAFQTAIKNLSEIDERTLQPATSKIKESMEIGEFIRLTSCEERNNETLVDQENDRILSLITISTSELEMNK